MAAYACNGSPFVTAGVKIENGSKQWFFFNYYECIFAQCFLTRPTTQILKQYIGTVFYYHLFSLPATSIFINYIKYTRSTLFYEEQITLKKDFLPFWYVDTIL